MLTVWAEPSDRGGVGVVHATYQRFEIAFSAGDQLTFTHITFSIASFLVAKTLSARDPVLVVYPNASVKQAQTLKPLPASILLVASSLAIYLIVRLAVGK